MSNCRTSCCVKDEYLLLPEKAGENNVHRHWCVYAWQ